MEDRDLCTAVPGGSFPGTPGGMPPMPEGGFPGAPGGDMPPMPDSGFDMPSFGGPAAKNMQITLNFLCILWPSQDLF